MDLEVLDVQSSKVEVAQGPTQAMAPAPASRISLGSSSWKVVPVRPAQLQESTVIVPDPPSSSSE